MHAVNTTSASAKEPANPDVSSENVTVSFVIPAYNEEQLIGRCLQSVINNIEAAAGTFEVIVVNNASSDDTEAIAKKFAHVRVIYEKQRGLVYARLAGFRASHGHLIANVDADNILPNRWLSRAIDMFNANHSLVALSGPCIYYDLSYRERFCVRMFYAAAYVLYILNRHILGLGSMLQGGNFIVRRDALEKIGGYSLDFPFYGEDSDLACRLHGVGAVQFSWNFAILSSGRRLRAEGLVRVGVRYALNYLWTCYLRRPFTRDWTNVRT